MHFIGAAHFWYAVYYDVAFVKPPVTHVAYKRMGGFAGKFKYLTFLNAVIGFLSNFLQNIPIRFTAEYSHHD